MTATITTAARRIVRTARAESQAYTRLYFTAAGELVSSIAGPETFGPRRDTYAICVGRDITQTVAQDLLDGYAAAMAAGVAPSDAAGIDLHAPLV